MRRATAWAAIPALLLTLGLAGAASATASASSAAVSTCSDPDALFDLEGNPC
ncbi:hypothetical protein KIH74_25085 [Kineosporia sp. J2-2]|uniref:Uncharacterized protein n=1 Tax=Kineosporia corallincola TaxID=2835133 RepID=A0ABS5TPE6_9ACTN|nr:hypothetical protein [Kineosporia corallincola]MBT0772244.1 hypothetical protein [Kineosporia corallincola]